MTWQRIDENTYIDDTLVTCAEYQLFIDEMREQGKYYQPDHWNSYQFTKGQAKEPILGMRQSDAAAFCEWLSYSEDSRWEYRLPTQEEAGDLPMPITKIGSLGYWTNDVFHFSRFNNYPEGARRIGHDYDRPFLRSFEYYFHDRNISSGLDLAIDLREAFTDIRIYNIDQMLDFAFLLAFDIAKNRDIDFDLAISQTRDQVKNLPLDLAHDQVLDPAIRYAIRFDRSLVIYLDLFTLSERIAGRSPAFEGIRLVKERIR